MKRKLNASFTVEMSVIAPLALFLIMGCILVIFYYHDRNILSAAAYETAVVGGTKAREKEGADAGELETLFRDRVRGKCILLAQARAGVTVSEEAVRVDVTASGAGMWMSLSRQAAVTDPEKEIRRIRRY